MIIVRLPAMLRRPEMLNDIKVDAPVTTIDELITELNARYPGLALQLDDAIFNFAVNDAIVLHGVREHALRPGDAVEIIPTISGG